MSWANFLARGEGVDDADIDAREAALDGDTMCDIIFTSGTTGAPKIPLEFPSRFNQPAVTDG